MRLAAGVAGSLGFPHVLLYDSAMSRCLFLLLLGSLCSQLLLASDTPNQQEVIGRLQRASAKTNIFELPSFAMKASVQVENRGQPVSGTYQLLWNGPNQWREEIILPSYGEIQVGGKGMIWVHRTTDFIPPPIYYLYQALGFGSNDGSAGAGPLVRMDFTQKDVFKKQRERKEHGTKLTCIEIENEQKHTSEICLNDVTGAIARNPSSFVDEDFQPVAGKVFPRQVAYLLDGKPVAKVVIDELTIVNQFPSSAFTPPAETTPQEGCMNPTPPRLTKRVQPEYPLGARSQHVQGTVKADVLIGLDGVVTIRKVVESPGSVLESSATHALEGWRYDPATCSGTPVQDSTILQVNYTLTYH